MRLFGVMCKKLVTHSSHSWPAGMHGLLTVARFHVGRMFV